MLLRSLLGVGRRAGFGLCVAAILVSEPGCRSDSTSPSKVELPTELSSKMPSDEELQAKLDEVLKFTFENRRLNLKDHAAWQIVHGALAFGRDFQVLDNDGKLVSAVDHVMSGGTMTGWTLRQGNNLAGDPPRIGLKAVLEAGTKTGQGHMDQWLGYLSDCKIPLDQKIEFGGRTYTLEDMLLQAEHDVPYNPEREYTWTLMALTAYRPTHYEWKAGDGNSYSTAKLLETETTYDLAASACGGTHRMSGITMAFNRHVQGGGKIEGAWLAAKNKIDGAVEAAKKYQNPDGSFSTNYFSRPGNSPDLASALGSTGHTLEFVILASSEEQLREAWIKRAVLSLCDLFQKTKPIDLECGALYHAAHGLVLYRQRLFGELPFLAAKATVESSAEDK